MTQTESQIIDAVLASPTYRYVDQATVGRLARECIRRYGLKRAARETKRLLHQVWGLYYPQPSAKVASTVNLNNVLAVHTSTRERLPYLQQFYDAIFAVTGPVETIADYGCGLNPLALASLGRPLPRCYEAFDIDSFTVDLLNSWFRKLGLTDRFMTHLGDLLNDKPITADVSLLLKVLPVLELQERGSSPRVLNTLSSRFVVVSYPTKSVSGKQKGMEEFYRGQFYQLASSHPWRVTERIIGNELIFIIQK